MNYSESERKAARKSAKFNIDRQRNEIYCEPDWTSDNKTLSRKTSLAIQYPKIVQIKLMSDHVANKPAVSYSTNKFQIPHLSLKRKFTMQ